MSAFLPLIVGFGGYNAAGRSSGYQSYNRMIFESLSAGEKRNTIASLGYLMGIQSATPDQVLQGTLVRKIEEALFDVHAAQGIKEFDIEYAAKRPLQFEIPVRSIPNPPPSHWKLEPLDEEARQFRVTLTDTQRVKINTTSDMAVKAAGQLPSGFQPANFYRSQHHPRGLQLAILGASDAVKSVGIPWSDIARVVSPDQIGVYSSSVMSQLDKSGFGGMLKARQEGQRVTSKQLALGLNTMPADFINAYVLGSVGSTGGITGACATFLYNLRGAVEEIKSGRKKVVLVGSSEAPILPEVIDGYSAMSALATDAELANLDKITQPDYRRASRPFGENCGFTLGESSQYVMLMADDLALRIGAKAYGAVPGVYVNADGYKKSISAPGAGNYVTMAKSVGLARTLFGDDLVKRASFVQAHGSSTPQNRVTESRIFDEVAKAFDIENWPVAAIKAYVGHSLGPASGDQLVASLGVFNRGILPGIKTIDHLASDVYGERLNISKNDLELGVDQCRLAFLNSKGFGGNNATATLIAPDLVNQFLENKYTSQELSDYHKRSDAAEKGSQDYIHAANLGHIGAIYEFGNNLIDETQISIDKETIRLPGHEAISLASDEGFEYFE